MTSARDGAPPFLTRVQIQNYRSIAACDVRLGPLTVLAGPNAAGKSNFLDAIRYIHDALGSSPGQALESRGGLQEVLHRGRSGQADSFRIRLEIRLRPERTHLPHMLKAAYTVEVGTHPQGGHSPVVRREELEEIDGHSYADGSGPRLVWQPEEAALEPVLLPREARDELVLPRTTRSNRETRALYRYLRRMRFYELLTPVLRAVDDTPGSRGVQPLGERGESLARVLHALAREYPWAKETIDGYLATMIDNAVGLDGVEVPEADLALVVGRFRGEDGQIVKVDRRSLSEGTLRLAAVLAALFQPEALTGDIPFVGIEEPEISLHPPMLGALYDALVAAADNTQVVVTTQSADLLDNAAADPEHLLVVRDDGTGSVIGPIDQAGRRLLGEGVLTLPELLRSGELRPVLPQPGAGEDR
ncbi:AAA family ATPase [Streptomyces sp. NPDC054766]|uniref:AAA family ATPase n=1 Tax=Streptomyces rhizosphaerihabitans TaxID=1266770 RepID=UPI0021C19CA4|nr:AAA family ATPase [Streptomyces rhizosphaerihabitans]MCT9008752.1 AAA family ATPase [Streptomyces rhizosphaerihabitans]